MIPALALLLAQTADPACIVWFHAEARPGNGIFVRAEATVEAPPEDVLRTLEDFNRYAEYMPRVKRAERRAGNHVFTEIKAPWPLKDVWFVAEITRRAQAGGFLLTWTMKQ